MNLMSLNRLGRPGGRDLVLVSRPEWAKRCRDTNVMSRHGMASRRSRHGNDVATWAV